MALAVLPLGSSLDGESRSRLSFLRNVAALFILAVWLTAPNDGGAQWGPRYLLPACVPLAVVSGFAVRELALRTRWRLVMWPCLVAMALAMLWIQRSSYRDLRIAKLIYGRIVHAVGEEAGDESLRAV